MSLERKIKTTTNEIFDLKSVWFCTVDFTTVSKSGAIPQVTYKASKFINLESLPRPSDEELIETLKMGLEDFEIRNLIVTNIEKDQYFVLKKH